MGFWQSALGGSSVIRLDARGQSLIQVVIGMAVMGIAMAAFMSMMTVQQKETKAVSDKLAALELERLLISSLADGSVCTGELAGTTINPSGNTSIVDVTQASASVTLTSLHARANSTSPTLITTATGASTSLNTLKVSSIAFKNFRSATGTLGDQYLADLTIQFDSSKLVRPIKPIVMTMNISTDPTTPNHAKKITSCSVSTGTVGPTPGTTCGHQNRGLVMYQKNTATAVCCYVDYYGATSGYFGYSPAYVVVCSPNWMPNAPPSASM